MYGQRLRELRLQHGYTMEEVGKLIGIKKSSYASYESKYRQPPIEKLKGLSLLFNVSVDYILGLTDERNTEESFQIRLKQVCSSKGFHWDGLEIPEDVARLLEELLEEAALKRNKQNKKVK